MNFRTAISLYKCSIDISYQDKLLFLGSCFSENINQKLRHLKFKSQSNPFGLAYNPISIINILDFAISKRSFTKADLFYHNELWSCFDFHSDMSGIESDKVLSKINESIISTHDFLKETKILFLTFGTAWVYDVVNKENPKKCVANCHKIASKNFEKRLLSVDEIINHSEKTIEKLKVFNPELELVFTISPVRHLKEGFVENNVSKSVLFLAVAALQNKFSKTSYFPSYEIILDDLRDYRFYKNDLVHPNELAIDYIFEQFETFYFNETTRKMITEVEKVQKMLQHKVNFKETVNYKLFRKQLLEKINLLENKGFDFEAEKSSFSL